MPMPARGRAACYRGEAPIVAAVPAITQAVHNAVGVWVDVPMTPERVVRALGLLD
jgi:CO/xanthine dehydrogenase Mo-binding subunit